MSILYIVSTPIGNLDDITLRAIAVMRQADRVLAEDTRRTSILFRRHEISTPLLSAHEHNEASRAGQLVRWLDTGETIALVSDAGTPLLSDPGARLVQAVIDAGHDVVPVPGPSALLAALVASGIAPEPFTFVGFLPRSGRVRTERVAMLGGLGHTAVLYEAPSRLVTLLGDLIEVCGSGRRVAVARELTKVHESVVRGTLAEVREHYAQGTVRGEVVVVLSGAEPESPSVEDATNVARDLLADGATTRTAARELGRRLGIPRNEAYALVLSLAEETGQEEK